MTPQSQPLTPDGHHVIIEGRRWRATDPLLPESVSSRLRHELARARGDVGAALRSGDAEREGDARARVQIAKTGLGERGTPWWEQTPAERQVRWEQALSKFRDQNA